MHRKCKQLFFFCIDRRYIRARDQSSPFTSYLPTDSAQWGHSTTDRNINANGILDI